jgi:hypothetical protein
MNDFVSEYSLKASDGYFWELDEPNIKWSSYERRTFVRASEYYSVEVPEAIVQIEPKLLSASDAMALLASMVASFLFLSIAAIEFFSGRMFLVVPAITFSLLSLLVLGLIRERQRG